MQTKDRKCEDELEGFRERYRELYIEFEGVKEISDREDRELRKLLETANNKVRKIYSDQEHIIRSENNSRVYEVTLEEFDFNWKHNMAWYRELIKLQ